jgi:hypothetical protein
LKLEAILAVVSEHFPSKEYLELQRRKEYFQRIGAACLTIAGIVGFSLLLFKAAQYKQELFGPEVLLWSAIGAVLGFLLLAVFFFNYPKLFLANPRTLLDDDLRSAESTAKLIEDRPAEYVSAATEFTTKNLSPRSNREK